MVSRFELTLQGPRGRYLNDVVGGAGSGASISAISESPPRWRSRTSSRHSPPAAREHRAGPLDLIGQGGVTWSAVYDMALFPSREAPVNNGMWFNAEWQKRWG